MSDEAVQPPKSLSVRDLDTSQALGESVGVVRRRARGIRSAFEDSEERGVCKGWFLCERQKQLIRLSFEFCFSGYDHRHGEKNV